MGNNIDLIICDYKNTEVNELDRLYLQLGNNVGRRDENFYLKEILTYLIRNNHDLNSDKIRDWLKKREKLFSNVDELIWSNPIMLDDILCKFNYKAEEVKALTMTSNMKNKIMNYLEKLKCIIDDEFSIMGNFNWEEYVGIRLQCYTNVIFTMRKLQLKILNKRINCESEQSQPLYRVNSSIEDIFLLVNRIFNKNLGSMEIYRKVTELLSKQKLSNDFEDKEKLYLQSDENASDSSQNLIQFPDSIDQIYDKNYTSNSETVIFVRNLLGFIWNYYKTVLFNGNIHSENSAALNHLFPNEVFDHFTDKNTILCLTEIIQTLLFKITFNAIANQSKENYCILEDLIELILMFGNNILSLASGNEKFIVGNCELDSNTTSSFKLEKKEFVFKILENMFSEDGIFFGIIKTCLIIISILTTGINHCLAEHGLVSPESNINFNKTRYFKEITSEMGEYSLWDVCIITIIIRIVDVCINIMKQLWKICSILSIEFNSFEYAELFKEDLFCGPMQFYSVPKNIFIVELHEKYSQVGIINESQGKLIKGLELEIMEKYKCYWKLIKIHNASHITIIFDKDCNTEKNNDILEIFGTKNKKMCDKNHEKFSYLISHYTESLFGKLSGSRRSWPKKPTIYEGNTLLVVFRTPLESFNKANNDMWRFKIYFQSHYWDQIIDNHILHKMEEEPIFQSKEILMCNLKQVLAFAVTAVTSSLSFMLRGPNINKIENKFIEILNSPLFVGGLATENNNLDDQECSCFLTRIKKDYENLFSSEIKCSAYHFNFNSYTRKLISSKHCTADCPFNDRIIYDKKFKNIFYKNLPNIDDIQDQIINNLNWGFIINFILVFSSIIQYNAKKKHMKQSIELFNDKEFMNIVRNDVIAGNIGSEKLSFVTRGYICCYLHHLGLYYNIFQLCENMLNSNTDLQGVIQLILENKSGKNIEYIYNHSFFEFTIKFVIQTEFCQPLLNIWTLGRLFRCWIVMERHKSEIYRQSEEKVSELNNLEFIYDYWLKTKICRISLILNLIPFSGREHPTISIKHNKLNSRKDYMSSIFPESQCNRFDISGSKYIYYPNKNLCFVLESIIGINKNESFFNKYQKENPELLTIVENNISSNKDNDSSTLDDNELELLNINQIIQGICDGIDYFVKTPSHIQNNSEENMFEINVVLSIRRLRAISRFEAFRIMEHLINNENDNKFLITSLIKSIRSLGKETPCIFPISSNVCVMGNLGICLPNHFYLTNEQYNNKINYGLEVHYTDNLIGCGKKIQQQVKDAYYKLLYSLINGKMPFSIGTEILKMSAFVYYSFKKMDSNDLIKTNFPTKVLNLLTGCNKNCELGNECIPSVSPGPYPIFLIFSIMCVRCSLLENSAIKLSLIFSSFVGLSHSISISGTFKGQLTTRELWRICEIYFMGNILILTSKMRNFLKNTEISRRERKIYLENMKYVFNRRNSINYNIKVFDMTDELFIHFFYIKPSIFSNIICRALESNNQVLHFYCIKFLWKFIPLISTESFLQQYSNRLIPNKYLLKTEIEINLNYVECFERYLEKIGQSFILFDNIEGVSEMYPPALLFDSSEGGLVESFNNNKGLTFDCKSRLINNDEFYKNFIFLLRFIALYSEKYENMKNMNNYKHKGAELVHFGFVQLLCDQAHKIPSVLDSLLNDCEFIKWEEVYKCIGTLAVIIDEYDCETYIGKLLCFQESQPNKEKIRKTGVLISNDPLKKEYSILVNECDYFEVKRFAYNSIKILLRENVSFPVRFMMSRFNFDTMKLLTNISNIALQYLSSLSANISNLEDYFSITFMDHTATISNTNKKKVICLQIISMSISFINILIKNGYIYTLNFNNNLDIDQLTELVNNLISIGMIYTSSINEKINWSPSISSIILNRRFIQRTLQKDKFSISSYYPIFKKSTQADLLHNSPYANIMLNLPTKWETGNRCFYYNKERTFIYNIKYHLLKNIGSVMFTANCCIPTSLSFYYFEFDFSLNEFIINSKHETDPILPSGQELSFYISIGLHRDGCQEGIPGSFGSYAYKNIGRIVHSYGEDELMWFDVETFNIGDTIGCGVDLLNQIVFFTKNGRLVSWESKININTEDSSCNYRRYYKFENVKGHFRPAVWIEKSNFIINKSEYLVVNANFGQELFKYKYINKLSYNNILSLDNEELSIFKDDFKMFTPGFENSGYYEIELNRRTMAFELHEIMGGSNVPLSMCISALESCGDDLDLAASWLLENEFQNSSTMSTEDNLDISRELLTIETNKYDDEVKYINCTTCSESNKIFDMLIGLRNNSMNYGTRKYIELINTMIFDKYHRDLDLYRKSYLDISKYFLVFGSFWGNILNRIESYNLKNNSQKGNMFSSFSSEIWFNSQFSLQGYGRETLSNKYTEGEMSNLTSQDGREATFLRTAFNNKTGQISFQPGTVVSIVPDIKYWMNCIENMNYLCSENTLFKILGTVIDINNSPKCRVIYLLKRLSRLTGVVWLCSQVTNSTLVQFFDHYSLVYYLVNLPSCFLIETVVNTRNKNILMTADDSTINTKTFQEYIENVFSTGVCDKNGKTLFYIKLPQIFQIYFKSEFLRCIKLARDIISKNIYQVQKYLIGQPDHKLIKIHHDILKIFKMVFGDIGPKISDYFVPMYSIVEKNLFSIYYKTLLNEESTSGFVKYLEMASKNETNQFANKIISEYISNIKNSVYSEIPVIMIETSHPCACMIDKKYDITFQDCDYFFAIFDPLCEINSDNLSFLTVTIIDSFDGKAIHLIKKTGRELSGHKFVIPANLFSIHLVTSNKNNDKYGIKAYFIPIKYSISDSKILENMNIHSSYVLLDLIFKDKGNSIDAKKYIKQIVEILLTILFEIHIPKCINILKMSSNKSELSFISASGNVIPIQNSFIHIVQQLIYIFIKYPDVTCFISEKSIVILDYLNIFFNIAYYLQMDQLQIVTNYGQNVNSKYCLMLQLHYLLFFYKNCDIFSTNKNYCFEETNFTDLINFPHSKLSLELQIQHNLVAELNLAYHDSSIQYYYTNNKNPYNIPYKQTFYIERFNENYEDSISIFLLNGDLRTHNMLSSGKKTVFNFCPWYNIISTSNISIPAFISSMYYIYLERFENKKNMSLEHLHQSTESFIHNLPEWEGNTSDICLYEPNIPLVLIEKLGEVQISILDAMIIVPLDEFNPIQHSISVDITQFIKEILDVMDKKLLLLPKNRMLWFRNQTLKKQLSHFDEPTKILNNPILINYSLKRVLTDEVILSKSVTFNYNELVLLRASAFDDTQDRVNLLWDLLINLNNNSSSKHFSNNECLWIDGCEDQFVSSKVNIDDNSFDPRIYFEYLNIYTFRLFREGNVVDLLKRDSKKTNYISLFESPAIQSMREFFMKSYSEAVFQRKYWPVFIGTIPIRDFESTNQKFNTEIEYNNKRCSEDEYVRCDYPSIVSNLREMNAPCSISFWIFPVNIENSKYTFSISNNKKFEILTNKINMSKDCSLSEATISEYLNNEKWKLIAYRGVTVSTISFWITEMGKFGIIVNSPNKNYPSNLLLNNQEVPHNNKDAGIRSFSYFIQNKSSIIEYKTTIIISNRKINIDQWNHIVVTIGTNKKNENIINSKLDENYIIKLYINGLFDESKNIPAGSIPLVGGDLPWVIGYPEYLKTDSCDNVGFKSSDNSSIGPIPNIFLGQDIGFSKLLRYLGPNGKYLNLVTGELLFGLIANFIVIHYEWEIDHIHNYIKNTFDYILFQDEVDEINSSEHIPIKKSNNKITKIYQNYKLCKISKYSKSLIHVFSNNWKNEPIVSHFNNIWQHEYININSNSFKETNIEQSIKSVGLINISIPKIIMHSKILNRNEKNIKLGVIALEKLEITCYKEMNKDKITVDMETCSCKDSPIDTLIMIGKNSLEDSVFVIRLKYLNKLFSDLTLSKLKKELDVIFEKVIKTSNYIGSYSNSVNPNIPDILHDVYSNYELIKIFHDYCKFNVKNTTKLDVKTSDSCEHGEQILEELKNTQNKEFLNKEMQEIIPSVSDYIDYLFNVIKSPERIFAKAINIKRPLFEDKVGCQNCKMTVLSYLEVCNNMLRRISTLFVSILNFIEIISPRPSVFKYSWLKMIRKYLSFSVKEVLISLCLAITESSEADGKIRVVINRPKSIFVNKKANNFTDSFGIDTVFGQLYIILEKIPPYKLRCKKRPWYVIYEGEGGIDAGGIYRDLLSHVCFELQSEKLPLFVICPNSNGYGEDKFYFVPNPSLGKNMYINLQSLINDKGDNLSRNFACCKESIYDSLYTFVGRLMGISIRTQIPLNLDIPTIIWKLILGEDILLKDLKQIDWYSVKFYEKLKHIEYSWDNAKSGHKADRMLVLEEFNSLDLCWSCLNVNGEVVELRCDGERIPVGINELGEYCRIFKEFKLEREFLHATNNIRKGIAEIIPDTILELQTHDEIEKLICGSPSIDIDLLKKHTKYTGYSPNDEVIHWFWEVISEISTVQQQKFLRFVWGRSRLPNKGVQWESNMEVVRVYGNSDSTYNEGTGIVESNQVNRPSGSENIDSVYNFMSLRLEELTSLDGELFRDSNGQLSITSHNQAYFTQQTTSNIVSGDTIFKESNEDSLLPTSHTCFFQLELPMYSSKEILREKLLYAITEGVEIDIDNIASNSNWE